MLSILKIIGLILLIIFLVILSLLLLLLFVPFRYSAKGKYDKAEEVRWVKCTASFLLHVIHISFLLDVDKKTSVRLFGIPIKIKKKSSKEIVDEETAEEEKDDENETDVNKTTFVEKIDNTKSNINFYKELFSKDSTKEAINIAIVRIGKTLKAILPRKGSFNIYLGLNNSGMTGEIAAIYYSLYAYIGKIVHFYPYYDEEILKGDFYLKGYVTVIEVIYHLLKIYFDKNCNKLIKILIRKKKGKK